MSTIAEQPEDQGAPTPVRIALPLRLAPGTELLGRYESSAFSQPQYLIRRADGQVLQVGQLAYAVATSIDGERDGAAIANAMSASLGRGVSGENVSYLVQHKLLPLGVLATEGEGAALTRVNPLLALRFRAQVVPERLHRGATWVLQPLFRPPVVAAVLTSLVAVNVWLFTSYGAALRKGSHDLVLHPALLLLVIALTIAAGGFHELGHATAARYGGARPGVMGVGIYLMLPAFYTDVTDSYRLDRRGRLRTDLGGVYFNAVAILVAGGVFLATGARALLVFIVLSEVEILYQFLPFVRMDGYYVVADLIGVPNLFAFVGPVVASLLGRQHPSRQRLTALTRRARVAIRAWVGLTVPILAFDLFMFILLAPHFFPGLWHSAQLFEKSAAYNLGRGNVVAAVDNGFQLLFLAVPAVGFALMAGMLASRLLRRLGPPLVSPVRDRPRWALATMAVVGSLLIAFILPGGRVGEPQMPSTASAAPTPALRGGGAPVAIANGHGRPADVFEVVVVGTTSTAGSGRAAVPGARGLPGGSGASSQPRGLPQLSTAPEIGAAAPVTTLPGPSGGASVSTPVGSAGASIAAPGPPVGASVGTPVGSAGASVATAPVGAALSTPIAPVSASIATAPAVTATASVSASAALAPTTPLPPAAPSASVSAAVGGPLVAASGAVAATTVAAPTTAPVAVPTVATAAPVTAPVAAAVAPASAPTAPNAPTTPVAAPTPVTKVTVATTQAAAPLSSTVGAV